MQCPYCKELRKDKVIDSRATEGGAVIRRRRVCMACKKRFTTYERTEEVVKLLVIKKDGRREPFERDKLLGSVQRASWKRPLGIEAIEALVADVEEGIFRNFDREVPSTHLGIAVAERLRKLDKVAYLRYASLYHEFQIVDEFIQEARDIIDREKRDTAGQQELFTE